jgi:hypothetical protein
MGRNAPDLGVSPWGNTGIGDPVTLREVFHTRTHLFDNPGSLQARDGGQGRKRVQSCTVIDVDEIEPHGFVADQDFSLSGFSGFIGFPL